MKQGIIIVLLIQLATNSFSQTVTYSEHIAPIIFNHCTPCHRQGEVAPFPLTNYAEAQSFGAMIKYVTGIKYMPPWKPNKDYRHYVNENYLSDTQIQLIADWVDQGMPQGNPANEPPLPEFPSGSQVGNPDLVVSFAQSYRHVGNNIDEYRYFVIPTGLTEDKDLVALEIRPGNKRIVHHTLVWADTTGEAAQLDAATPDYGYQSGSGSAASLLNGQLPGYVPGQKPQVYSQGMGMRLKSGSDLKLQMHYAPTPVDEYDSTTINLFFAQEPVTRYVKSHVMVPLPSVLTNGPFVINPNTVKEFHGRFTVPMNVSMVGIAPHMHLLGTKWRVYAVKPTGDTIPLIKIDDWDFNWQGNYTFTNLIPLPQGSVIHAYAEYDNTTNNPFNPNNPPIAVSWGEGTADEMYYLPLLYLDYQPGDENISLDIPVGVENNNKKIATDRLYPINPNPASNKVKVGFTLGGNGNVSVEIKDAGGKIVAQPLNNKYCLVGLHTLEVNVENLAAGVYFINLQTPNTTKTQKMVVKH